MALKYSKVNPLYNTKRWRTIRAIVLSEEPTCRMCKRLGKITPADTVDHIKPHKGDLQLFYDRDNLQALCASCHSGAKRIQETKGYSKGCDVDGLPLDDGHWWGK